MQVRLARVVAAADAAKCEQICTGKSGRVVSELMWCVAFVCKRLQIKLARMVAAADGAAKSDKQHVAQSGGQCTHNIEMSAIRL